MTGFRVVVFMLFAAAAVSTASARLKIIDIGNPLPPPRALAEKCKSDRERGTEYAKAVYDDALNKLAAQLQQNAPGGVEFDLNQQAVASLKKCRDRARSMEDAARAEQDCASFKKSYDSAMLKLNVGAKAGKSARSYKDVLKDLRDPLLSCMEKFPCGATAESTEQASDLFRIASTMIKEGVLDSAALTKKTVTVTDIENPNKKRTFNIGRKFCGVTIRQLYDRCTKAGTCTDRQSLAEAIRDFASSPWMAGGGSHPPGPSNSGSLGGGR